MFQEQQPGIQGAKRATWRDNDPRPLVARIIAENPKLDINAAFEVFWQEIHEDSDLLQTVARYYWDNAFAAHVRSVRLSMPEQRKQRELAERKAVEEAKARIQARVRHEASIILLTMKMPNGKPLGECTGKECGTFGGWFQVLADRVPSRKTVAEVLSEKQLQSLWENNRKAA